MEARILENLGNGMNKKQFQIVPGVDQLGLTLVTRAINEIRGDKPAVYPLFAPGTGGSTVPLYTDESAENSVHNQIIAIGGKIASSTKKADLILAVNTPDDGICRDSTANENAPYSNRANKEFAAQIADLERMKPIALADIAYANGADNGLWKRSPIKKPCLTLRPILDGIHRTTASALPFPKESWPNECLNQTGSACSRSGSLMTGSIKPMCVTVCPLKWTVTM